MPESKENKELNKYLKSLSPKELKGYNIAKTHLESSFDVVKSYSYLKWKNQDK